MVTIWPPPGADNMAAGADNVLAEDADIDISFSIMSPLLFLELFYVLLSSLFIFFSSPPPRLPRSAVSYTVRPLSKGVVTTRFLSA